MTLTLGMASARRAASYGAKVLLIERGREHDGAGLGGTCVNLGKSKSSWANFPTPVHS